MPGAIQWFLDPVQYRRLTRTNAFAFRRIGQATLVTSRTEKPVGQARMLYDRTVSGRRRQKADGTLRRLPWPPSLMHKQAVSHTGDRFLVAERVNILYKSRIDLGAYIRQSTGCLEAKEGAGASPSKGWDWAHREVSLENHFHSVHKAHVCLIQGDNIVNAR